MKNVSKICEGGIKITLIFEHIILRLGPKYGSKVFVRCVPINCLIVLLLIFVKHISGIYLVPIFMDVFENIVISR